MQISLTKELAKAVGVEVQPASNEMDPFFCWTADLTNAFQDHKKNMIVMVNHATRFTVLIYGVKRRLLHTAAEKMAAAIRDTLLEMNINPKIVDEYFKQAGEITFVENKSSQITAWVNQQSLEAASVVSNMVNDTDYKINFEDTLGYAVSKDPVDKAGKLFPYDEMVKALAAHTNHTGLPLYQYRAFELLVTLDLEVYQATRRLIVPANLELAGLHEVLQDVFGWANDHLYDFAVLDERTGERVVSLVASKEDRVFGDILLTGHKLSDFFPKCKQMLYTYDFGDQWEHLIELVKVINHYDKKSPYLVKASGQTPPEDVGGVDGFIDFRKIILNPKNPQYNDAMEWSGGWSPELIDEGPYVVDFR